MNLLLTACCFVLAGAEGEWGYHAGQGKGPAEWHTLQGMSLCRDGRRQSPISLDVDAADEDTSLRPFDFSGYRVRNKVTVENSGHSVYFSPSNEDESFLKGGSLQAGNFRLMHVHVHWGADDGRGSEHVIDGRRYPAEFHMVHWDTKYAGPREAINSTDGIAVIGVMAEIGEENAQLKKLLTSESIKQIEYADTGFDIPTFDFDFGDFMPEDRSSYFRYDGGLTVPGCQESLTWSVMAEPIQVSRDQLELLRKLLTSGKDDVSVTGSVIRVAGNFRPLQPLNGRQVRKSSFRRTTRMPPPDQPIGGASAGRPDVAALVAALAVLLH